MAYNPLLNAEIEAGDPVTQDLWDKAQDNFDDHESRIVSLEGGSAVAYLPLVWGARSLYWVRDDIGIYRLPFGVNLLACRLLVVTAGSSGSTQIDIKKKTSAGAWTSVFSTLPSVPHTDGNFAISTNAVFSITTLAAADLVRCDITTVQGGSPNGIQVFLEFEKV